MAAVPEPPEAPSSSRASSEAPPEAAPQAQPQAPPYAFELEWEEKHDGGMIVRLRLTTGVVIVGSFTVVTIAAMLHQEKLRNILENISRSLFGEFVLRSGSLVIDIHCSTAKRVKELIKAYRCGELKRRFLQELRKVGGSVENLKIKFQVEETLELNKSREQRILKQGQVKGTEQPDEGTGMSNQEFIEILEDIRKLGEVKNIINKGLKKKDLRLRDEDGRTPLHHAVLLKQMADLKYLLGECDEDIVNIPDCDGRTVLHLVFIQYDDTTMIDDEVLCLPCKTSINAKDSEGCTPLHYAAMRSKDLVSFLISSGADISVIDENGKTPLDYAFEFSNITAIELLVRYFARHKIDEKSIKMQDYNVVDKKGRTILHYAGKKFSEPAIIALLDSGVNINAVDNDGMSASDHALAGQHLENAVLLSDIMLEKKSPEHLFLGLWKNLQTKDYKAQTLLHYSVMHFKQNVLDILLERNVNLNEVDRLGMSASHFAAKCGNVVALEKLVKSGASVEGRDNTGRTVLHLAASHGDERMVDLLIKKTANVNETDNKGRSALHYSIKQGNLVAAMMLLEAGASVEVKDNEGRTVLHLAASHGDERMVDLLIKKTANVNEIDNKGRSALHYAIEQGNLVAATKLLEAGASVEVKDKKGQTVLHLALQRSDEKLIDLLIKNNASVNEVDNKGRSALHYSIEQGNLITAMKLLEAGASAEGKDDEGQTVLHYAVQRSDEKLIDLLIQNNASVNEVDNKGRSALHYSIEQGNLVTAMKLLEAGASVKGKDDKGQTLLHCAAMYRKEELLQLLLKNNEAYEIINDLDYEGKSVLHYVLENALETGNPRLAFQLVNDGAKATLVKDKQGKTLLHYAVDENNRNALNILLRCNLDLNGHDSKGKAALHYAVEAKNTDVIEMLLKAGADVNIKDIEHKFTPLHIAAMQRDNELTELLLHHNANPNLKNYIGRTAISYARYPDIIKKMEDVIANLSLEDNGD